MTVWPVGCWRWFWAQFPVTKGDTARRPHQLRLRYFPSIAAEVERLEARQLLTVVYNGGTLLPHVEAQAVYLGSDWKTSSNLQPQTTQIDQFLSTIVNSPYMDMLTNAGYNVGRGTASTGAIDNLAIDKTPTVGITDSQIETELQTMVNSGQLQTPDANRLYVVFAEPGVVVHLGTDASNTTFLGYHSVFVGTNAKGASTPIHYAVIAYPGSPNYSSASQGFSSDFNFLTAVSSHELAEAVTDPDVGTLSLGWYDFTLNGEIADLAGGHYSTVDGYQVQDVVDQNDNIITPPVTTITLTAPNLSVAAVSSTSASLSWGAVSQALGYRVYEVNGSTSTLLATVTASTTSYQVNGLTPASSVSFYVEAYNGPFTADSTTVGVMLPLATPQLTATASSPTSASLSWGAVSQALGYRVYEVNGSTATLLATVTASTTSYQVNGLTPASTVSFYVEAYNGSITADSTTVSVTLPLATPQLTATASSPTSASLSWGAVSQALGYRVFEVNGSTATLLATVTASTTSYQVNGLTPASTVSFYVEAYNGSVTADSTTLGVTLPLATPQLTATASSPTSVSLSWGAVSQALGYRVFEVNGSTATLLATGTASTTSYQVNGLTPASTVSFYVEAYNGSVTADSTTLGVTLPLATPQLTATAISPTSVSLSWGAVSQALGYRVFEVNGSTATLLATVTASTTSYQANGLTPASTVSFYVEAYNGSVTADSTTVSVTLPSGVAAPQVTATTLSSTAVLLSWNAISGARSYSIYGVLLNGGLVGLGTVYDPTTSYTVTGLQPGSTVQFKVQVNTSTSGAMSAVVTVTLPLGTTSTLATPQLTATASSPTSASLSWGAVSQALGYRVYEVNGSTATLLATVTASTISYQVNGLTPASSVSFYLEAYNGSITADSTTVSVTLPLPTPQLTASASSPTSASLSWGTVSQALGYRVYEVNGSTATLLTTVTASTTSYQAIGLTPASTVSFYVEAYNGSVTADSTTVGVTLPLAAPQLTATVISSNSVSLSWGAVSQALGYRVYEMNGSTATLLTTVSASTTSYQVGGLALASTVSFYVEAYNGSVIADSTTVSVTLPGGVAAPQVTATILSSTSVLLSWNAISGARSYSIYGVLLNGGLVGLGTVYDPTTSYTVTGLQPGSTVQFKVQVNTSTSGAMSAIVTVTLPSSTASASFSPVLASLAASTKTKHGRLA